MLDELFGVGVRAVPDRAAPRRASRRTRSCARSLEAARRATRSRRSRAATGLTVAETRAALGRLEADGHLVRRDLGGWERAAR